MLRGGIPLDRNPCAAGRKGQTTVCILFGVLQNLKGCQRRGGLSLVTEIPRAVSDYMQAFQQSDF
jgi:hypothetical protein